MERSIDVYAAFMGCDATIRVAYHITSWGSPAHIDRVWGGEPAEGPEWEIDEIGITLDLDDGAGAEWVVDERSRAFRVIANCQKVNQAIIDDICTVDRPRRRYRRAA